MLDPDDVSLLPYVLMAITFWSIMGVRPYIRLRRTSSSHEYAMREFRQKARG